MAKRQIFYNVLYKVVLLGLTLFKPESTRGQFSGNGGEILHSDDVLQIHSTLDELIEGASTSISEKPIWLDYPKPYTRELIREHHIKEIDFQSAIISNNNKTVARPVSTDSLPSSIKYTYTYNENGDLLSYSEFSIKTNSRQPGRYCNLRKSYDDAGRLIAWQWIAPPYDTLGDIYNHLKGLSTLMQRQYGPYNKRAWIQRDQTGMVIRTVYADERPKYKKNIKYGRESRFEGNITEYYLKTIEYNPAGQMARVTRFKPVLDSATISKSSIPAALVFFRYSKDRQIMEKIHILNSGPLEDSSYWPIGVYRFNLKRKAALDQVDTYRARFPEKDSNQVMGLMQSGRMFVNEPGSQSLIPAIPGRLELIAQENIKYDIKSRVSQYSLTQENYPTAIITREYKGKWFIEKGYRLDGQHWLARRFKRKLMTNEFYTTGFDDQIPSNISGFFIYGREKGKLPHTFPYELSRTTYNYRNQHLSLGITYYCDSTPPSSSKKNSTKKQVKELASCFEPLLDRLRKNNYKSLFLNWQDERKEIMDLQKRQMLFNYNIKTNMH